MLVEEVKAIFEAQRRLGNDKATRELEDKYLEIMLSQRSFDMGPGVQTDGTPSPYAINGFSDRVGNCTFERGEKRAAKATYTAELFVALQRINQIRLVDKNGQIRLLTSEERQQLIDLIHKNKEIQYKTVRKQLNIASEYKFNTLNYSSKTKKADNQSNQEDNIGRTENVRFVSMPFYYEYMKKIGHKVETLSENDKTELLDHIGTILTMFKNDDSRTGKLQELGLDKDEIDSLLELTPSKFQHLSLKAIRKIIPFLKNGMLYHDACAEAGYDFKADNIGEKKKLLKGEEITAIINEITNPVVKCSVSQTVKVVNAIIMKYGSPQAVNIELAREMAKNFSERREMEKNINERFRDNEKIKVKIQELGVLSPKGQDIVKYRLWEEQQGRCLYSGKVIPAAELFEPGYEVDHILPYSITFDDSYHNKVLVIAQENQQKGNRIPYEYMGSDEARWREFEQRVGVFVRDYKKQQKLLKKNFTEEERKQFKERNLNDTKYITTVIYNMIRQNLELAPYNQPGKKKQVWAVNGVITDQLKKRWGIPQKDRSTDTHHAVDAVVIACCTDSMIQKISRNSQAKELFFSESGSMYDGELGKYVQRENFSREEWDKMYGVQIPRPWNEFKHELDVRMCEDPKLFLETHEDIRIKLDYPFYVYDKIHPLFVSRMPNHKIAGAAHKYTVRSARHMDDGGSVFDDGGYVISRTSLENLKLDKDGEIDGYYNRESDKLLYNALKRQLQLYGNDAKKAFADDFYKPKADGSKGPVVRKVKVYEKMSSGVFLNDGRGIASNDSMVRIDVFCENGKYYFVPIYVADAVKKQLPNKVSSAGKSYRDWKNIEDKNFIFSLYSRDLVHIKSKKGVKVNLVNNTQQECKELFVYFTAADISTASIAGIAHDSSYQFRGLGIQSLEKFEKCQVDVLGNISIIKSEKRMGFS